MSVYIVVYRRMGSDKWWTYQGSNSNGVYVDLGVARRIATRILGRYAEETAILESEVEWATVEFK